MTRISNIKEKAVSALIHVLAEEGLRIIKKASESNETTKRSGNMEDAYGCAVFYKGRIVEKRYLNENPESSIEHKGWSKMGIESNTGRGYLDEWFNTYVPNSNKITLVCVNAVYYSRILENGAQGRPHRDLSTKYRIITQVSGELDKLASRYKGVVKCVI